MKTNILYTTRVEGPVFLEETNNEDEWMDNQQRLVEAMGFTSEYWHGMLFVYDGEDLQIIYHPDVGMEEANVDVGDMYYGGY